MANTQPRILPGIGLTGFWKDGDNGWGSDMNKNLRTLSSVTQLVVDSITTALPGTAPDGTVTVNPPDGVIKVRDAGAWVDIAPAIGWRCFVVDAGSYARFMGSPQKWVLETSGGGGGSISGPKGSGLAMQIWQEDIAVTSTLKVASTTQIPQGSIILYAHMEIIEAVTGTTQVDLDFQTAAGSAKAGNYSPFLDSMAKGTNYWTAPFSSQITQWGAHRAYLIAKTTAFTGGKIRVTAYLLTGTKPTTGAA